MARPFEIRDGNQILIKLLEARKRQMEKLAAEIKELEALIKVPVK